MLHSLSNGLKCHSFSSSLPLFYLLLITRSSLLVYLLVQDRAVYHNYLKLWQRAVLFCPCTDWVQSKASCPERKSGLGLLPGQCHYLKKSSWVQQQESQTVLTLKLRREAATWCKVVWFSWSRTPDCDWRTWSRIYPLGKRANKTIVRDHGSSQMSFRSG